MSSQESTMPLAFEGECRAIDRTATQTCDVVVRTNETEILRPTVEAYEALERAFDYFNVHLFVRTFGIELPHVMLTMPKHKRCMGYFQKNSWNRARDQRTCASEIALNPKFFASQIEVCQTLVHEMVHLAQAVYPKVFGSPSKRGYHNDMFAKTMITLGLMPSTTGKPGGKKTGVGMSDYVLDGGLFVCSYEQFVELGYEIRWSSMLVTSNGQASANDGQTPADNVNQDDREREQKKQSKTKFSCAVCGLNAWAKPQAKLGCVVCTTVMQKVSA